VTKVNALRAEREYINPVVALLSVWLHDQPRCQIGAMLVDELMESADRPVGCQEAATVRALPPGHPNGFGTIRLIIIDKNFTI
jgi:hypothetical protein